MAEYYVKRAPSPKPDKKQNFTVYKFDGGDQPVDEYPVTLDVPSDIMQCGCPNKRRGAGVEDKHCVGVRGWLADGEPTHAVPMGAPQSKQMREKYHEDPNDDIPF